MQNPIISTILVGFVAGAAGAMLSTLIVEPATSEGDPIVLDDNAGDLERRFDSLQRENEALSRRLLDLEQAPPRLAAERSAAPLEMTDEERAADEQLRAVVAALTNPDAPMPKEWRDSVNLALKDIRAEEDADRDEQRRIRAEDRMEERMVELSQKLGLDTYQSGQMRQILTEESLARDEMRTAIRESGDWASARDQWTGLREKTNESLSRVLTPQQVEAYQADQSTRWGRFGGGGNTGGGPRSGGGVHGGEVQTTGQTD
ncbi:MAG: hypothetical protein VYE81_09610 [Planctomycetota bacterium]|nr:hypothetical protein [Planctomycetota bacterium]